MKITFDDLKRWGYPSVTDYCRHLVEYAPESGQDLKDKIEVYRGDMLCLTVRSIEEGAKLDVMENKHIGPVFVKWKDKTMSAEAKAALALNRAAKGVTSDRTAI